MASGSDVRRPPTTPSLLLAIHDVSPAFDRAVSVLSDKLSRLVGEAQFAMLVVPDYWGRARLDRDAAFCSRLRSWADAGVEIFLHGWLHRDDAAYRNRSVARWKARHLTAGEGEFLGLSEDDAFRRMRDGRDLVEQVIGRPVVGFVAPAWLYGPGTRAALRRSQFAIAEDHWRVWSAPSGTVLARGPVVTWASRTPGRMASSLAVAALARRLHHVLPVARIAVHPGDTREPVLIDSIERTVRTLAVSRKPARYTDLLTTGEAIP